jgi:MraZ protein
VALYKLIFGGIKWETMYKGRYNYAVDDKGRASLPARFRDSIVSSGNDRVVLTFALDAVYPHVDLYPFERWLEFETKLAAKPIFDENVIILKRLYVANAVECAVDSHGRILIPATHREYAGILNEATWVGMTRTIELWNPASWDKAQGDALAAISDVRNGLSGFEL